MENEKISVQVYSNRTGYPGVCEGIAKVLNTPSEQRQNSNRHREVTWQKDVKSLIRDKEMLNIITTYQLGPIIHKNQVILDSIYKGRISHKNLKKLGRILQSMHSGVTTDSRFDNILPPYDYILDLISEEQVQNFESLGRKYKIEFIKAMETIWTSPGKDRNPYSFLNFFNQTLDYQSLCFKFNLQADQIIKRAGLSTGNKNIIRNLLYYSDLSPKMIIKLYRSYSPILKLFVQQGKDAGYYRCRSGIETLNDQNLDILNKFLQDHNVLNYIKFKKYYDIISRDNEFVTKNFSVLKEISETTINAKNAKEIAQKIDALFEGEEGILGSNSNPKYKLHTSYKNRLSKLGINKNLISLRRFFNDVNDAKKILDEKIDLIEQIYTELNITLSENDVNILLNIDNGYINNAIKIISERGYKLSGNEFIKLAINNYSDILLSQSQIDQKITRKQPFTLNEETFKKLFYNGSDIAEINQQSIGACYTYTALEILKKTRFFGDVIRRNIKQTNTGREVRFPFNDSNAQRVSVAEQEIKQRKNNQDKQIADTSLGFNILELAYIKKRNYTPTITNEVINQIEGGKTGCALRNILGELSFSIPISGNDNLINIFTENLNKGKYGIAVSQSSFNDKYFTDKDITVIDDKKIQINNVKIVNYEGHSPQNDIIDNHSIIIYAEHAYSIEKYYVDNTTGEKRVWIVNPHHTEIKFDISLEQAKQIFNWDIIGFNIH